MALQVKEVPGRRDGYTYFAWCVSCMRASQPGSLRRAWQRVCGDSGEYMGHGLRRHRRGERVPRNFEMPRSGPI